MPLHINCQLPHQTQMPCHRVWHATPFAIQCPFAMPCQTATHANCQSDMLHNKLQFDAIILSPSSNCGRDWSKWSSPSKRAHAHSPSNSHLHSGSPPHQRRRCHASTDCSCQSPNPRRSHQGFNNKARSKGGEQPFFPGGTVACGSSACAICLGHHKHKYTKCSATKLWNRGKTCVCRNKQGRLVTMDGLPICFSFQTPAGCSETTHPARHTCSGCGKSGHGTQQCFLTQKV